LKIKENWWKFEVEFGRGPILIKGKSRGTKVPLYKEHLKPLFVSIYGRIFKKGGTMPPDQTPKTYNLS